MNPSSTPRRMIPKSVQRFSDKIMREQSYKPANAFWRIAEIDVLLRRRRNAAPGAEMGRAQLEHVAEAFQVERGILGESARPDRSRSPYAQRGDILGRELQPLDQETGSPASLFGGIEQSSVRPSI